MHLASDDFAWYLRSMHDHISRTDDGLRWQWKAEEDVVHHFGHQIWALTQDYSYLPLSSPLPLLAH